MAKAQQGAKGQAGGKGQPSAKAAAKKIFTKDPGLKMPEHKTLEKILILTQESAEKLRSG